MAKGNYKEFMDKFGYKMTIPEIQAVWPGKSELFITRSLIARGVLPGKKEKPVIKKTEFTMPQPKMVTHFREHWMLELKEKYNAEKQEPGTNSKRPPAVYSNKSREDTINEYLSM